MAIYERHQPEKTILYQTVARAWPKISLEHAVEGETIPRHLEAEFDRYKRCGILDYGFVRLYCKACDAERFVGFSCKGALFARVAWVKMAKIPPLAALSSSRRCSFG